MACSLLWGASSCSETCMSVPSLVLTPPFSKSLKPCHRTPQRPGSNQVPFSPPWQCALSCSHLGFPGNVSPGAQPSRDPSFHRHLYSSHGHLKPHLIYLSSKTLTHGGFQPTVLCPVEGLECTKPRTFYGCWGWQCLRKVEGLGHAPSPLSTFRLDCSHAIAHREDQACS